MSQGVDSFSILALTFTNKAAREMKGRIADLVGDGEAKNLWMGTFHSVFARILRSEADKFGLSFRTLQYTIPKILTVFYLLLSKKWGLKKMFIKPSKYAVEISSYKNSLITVRAYYNDGDLQESDAMARDPKWAKYIKSMSIVVFKAGAMDFDDLLLKN